MKIALFGATATISQRILHEGRSAEDHAIALIDEAEKPKLKPAA